MPKPIVGSGTRITVADRSFRRCERLDSAMRRVAATIGVPARLLAAAAGVMLGMLASGPVALGATAPAKSARSAQAALASSLNSTIRHAGGHTGAYVLDID